MEKQHSNISELYVASYVSHKCLLFPILCYQLILSTMVCEKDTIQNEKLNKIHCLFQFCSLILLSFEIIESIDNIILGFFIIRFKL